MGYKKLSNEQEKQLVQEYVDGTPVKVLMEKYGYKTKKSITDKVKKYYGENYNELIQQAKDNRKTYSYKFEKINNEFDAYFLGLLLTDGYVSSRGYDIGLDLTDEDVIQMISTTIGKEYKAYEDKRENRKNRYRIVLTNKELVDNLSKYGITPQKSLKLQGPILSKEEEKFIPYIIRGIIDGDGNVTQTSYGAPHFRIYSASEDFIDWIIDVLTNKMYMIDLHKTFTPNETNGMWHVDSANQDNILKLIAMSYNKPFGMARKYDKLRKTFRDYNSGTI